MTLSSKLKSFRTRYFSPCVKAKDEALMKQKLLNPLSFSSPNYEEAIQEDVKPHWIIGIDPHMFGALAVLKFDDMRSCSAQVYDTRLQVLVQKIVTTRYDANSMLELIRTLDVPSGTKAFIATIAISYSQDDMVKDAYEGGVGYGLWSSISSKPSRGILLTSHISVISVAPSTWKKHFRFSIWSQDTMLAGNWHRKCFHHFVPNSQGEFTMLELMHYSLLHMVKLQV